MGLAAQDVWRSPALGAAAPISPDGPAPVVLSSTVPVDLPIIRGSAGLVDRPRTRPVNDDLVKPVGEDEAGVPVFWPPAAEGLALPGNCLRVLSSPRGGCSGDCPGLQRDGGCLADVARDCHGRGESPVFVIDPEGFWLLKP